MKQFKIGDLVEYRSDAPLHRREALRLHSNIGLVISTPWTHGTRMLRRVWVRVLWSDGKTRPATAERLIVVSESENRTNEV